MICTPRQILSGDQIEKNEMGWTCGTYGEEEILVGRTDGKRTLRIYRRRWEDNIQMDLQ